MIKSQPDERLGKNRSGNISSYSRYQSILIHYRRMTESEIQIDSTPNTKPNNDWGPNNYMPYLPVLDWEFSTLSWSITIHSLEISIFNTLLTLEMKKTHLLR